MGLREAESDLWKGYISVATALTWARGEVRELLLKNGANPDVEQAMKECMCVIGRRKERTFCGDTDDD